MYLIVFIEFNFCQWRL